MQSSTFSRVSISIKQHLHTQHVPVKSQGLFHVPGTDGNVGHSIGVHCLYLPMMASGYNVQTDPRWAALPLRPLSWWDQSQRPRQDLCPHSYTVEPGRTQHLRTQVFSRNGRYGDQGLNLRSGITPDLRDTRGRIQRVLVERGLRHVGLPALAPEHTESAHG